MSWNQDQSEKMVPVAQEGTAKVGAGPEIGLTEPNVPKEKPKKTLRYIKDKNDDVEEAKQFTGFVFGFQPEDQSLSLGSEYLDKSKMANLCFPRAQKSKSQLAVVEKEILGEGEDINFPDKKVFVFLGKPEEKTITDCPPVFGTTDDVIIDYFEKYNLKELMEYLLGMVSLHTPDNPYEFISSYANKIIQIRHDPTHLSTLPRIFTKDDVRAMFRVLDKQYRRKISLAQYKAGMESFGLVRFNPEPKGACIDGISQETFCNEAWAALELQLKSFIGPY